MAAITQTSSSNVHRQNPSSGTQEVILSTSELCEKISRINADQIELIGNKIAENILNNLGPVAKLSIARKVWQASPSANIPPPFMMMMEMMKVNADKQKGKEFLSDRAPLFFTRNTLAD